jgi:hypothetical protein
MGEDGVHRWFETMDTIPAISVMSLAAVDLLAQLHPSRTLDTITSTELAVVGTLC